MIMDSNFKNRQGGFIRLILTIVLLVILLKFLGLKVSDVVDWFKSVL